ncbi:MAG: STAS/SEC14 domain-containing protein [Polyangiales bacterium]
MPELYRNDYMTVTADEPKDWVILSWSREEPSDEHSVGTAKAVQVALDKALVDHPNTNVLVLVDLMVVKKTFPRATASYTQWLLSHRSRIKAGAFATGSFLLRTAVSAAMIVPGLTMKGFSDLDDAKKFLRSKA